MSHKTLLCVSVQAQTHQAMLAQMQRVAPEADVIELRLDALRDGPVDVARLLDGRPKPVVVTHRPTRQGGAHEGDEAQRVAVLQQAVDLGADYVDVELDAVERVQRRGGTRFIVSHHDFSETPRDLDALLGRIADTRPDVAKVAVMANDLRDNLRLFEAMGRSPVPVIGICMGEAGMISRVLAPKFRGFLMFASVEEGCESGPGQLTVAQLRRTYRFDRIGPDTTIYGLIGDPVAHSMSPAIHNAAFDATDLDAVYVLLKVEGDPADFVRDFEPLGAQGYSVTIPHKERVIQAMDEVEPLVRRIGAMNTVVVRDGRRMGHNTDYSGALQALERALGGDEPLRGKRVAILGAGGAARALAFGAVDRGARVVICNRTHPRGVKLAQEVGCQAHPLAELGSLPRPEVLINTTRVGMWPETDASPVDVGALAPGMVVYDSVYNPLQTRLLTEAGRAGCQTLGGVDWFIGQGAAQFELWTQRPAPREVMRQAMLDQLAVKA